MIPKTIVHLLSGGLDSVTLLYDLKQQGHSIHCVLFDYKQQHVQELNFAKGHCHRLGVLYTTIELPALGGLTDESWVVPFRNPIMLSLAANVGIRAKAEEITIACNRDDAEQFPDCRQEVLSAMNQVLKLSGYKAQIAAPFLAWPKWKIGDLARELGVDTSQIWTCYRGGSKPCGECPACKKLEGAFVK